MTFDKSKAYAVRELPKRVTKTKMTQLFEKMSRRSAKIVIEIFHIVGIYFNVDTDFIF